MIISSWRFKDKRTTIISLRWLLIIALSYLLLFHTGHLQLSWQMGSLILLYGLSNLVLILIPSRFFDRTWLERVLIAVDSLIITAAIIATELSSTYLLLFYFLIILSTTMGRGSSAVLGNGLIMVGMYLLFLFQTEGKQLLEDTGLLLHLPFLVLCTVVYAVLVDQEHRKQHLMLDQVRSAEASQNTLRTEIKEKEQALRKVEDLLATLKHQALHDVLTGLPNRTLLTDRLQQAILIGYRGNKQLALIMLDLDNFKDVNDALGYHMGDLLLQQFASRLREVLREADTIARLGSDEFGVLACHVTDASGAIMVASRILTVLEEPFVIAEHSLEIRASLGIVLFPEHGTDAAVLMRRVSMA
ncbi:MAG: GGDEF domain-containing protein, partial [Nitrospira sp.]|nr:GGDEF domain-containing protein [Nitrospira sp.]